MRIACPLALALVLGGCAPQPLHRPLPAACEPSHTLFVVSHGWHTGIVVNRMDLLNLLPVLAPELGQQEYVEIGWGEERYYQDAEPTSGMGLRALLWPNASVLQVVPFGNPPRRYFPQSDVVEVRVDEAGYRAALAFMAATFTRTPEGGVIRLGPSLYGNGRFYRAEGSFHAFNTCNTWVARAIEKTGFPISGSTTLTAGGVVSQLRDAGDGGGRCIAVR